MRSFVIDQVASSVSLSVDMSH